MEGKRKSSPFHKPNSNGMNSNKTLKKMYHDTFMSEKISVLLQARFNYNTKYDCSPTCQWSKQLRGSWSFPRDLRHEEQWRTEAYKVDEAEAEQNKEVKYPLKWPIPETPRLGIRNALLLTMRYVSTESTFPWAS